MSDEHHLSERDRAWLEHTRNCGTGCLSTYAKANGLDVQRLYAAKSRLKSKGVLGEAQPKRLVRVQPQSGTPPIAQGYCRVHLRNGVVLEVAMGRGDWDAIVSSTAALP
jgi:hypothetical protein